MKSLFYKIVSSFMAFLVLLSTVTLTVDAHYCGKTLVDFSIFNDVDTCGMDMGHAGNADNNALDEKMCCTDTTFTVEGQNNIKTSFEKLNFDQQVFVASFVYSYLNLFEGLEQNIVPFRDYFPPLLVQDLAVLHDTFLI